MFISGNQFGVIGGPLDIGLVLCFALGVYVVVFGLAVFFSVISHRAKTHITLF